ncbi:MAG: sortase [Candidatus Andersenbacteria bacterium]
MKPQKHAPNSWPARTVVWGLLFIAVGLGGYYLYNTAYNRAIVSFKIEPPPAIHPQDASAPTAIAIPSVGIDLPVEPGVINRGIWSVSEFYANHLKTSAYPGTKGNIIIYGHDKTEIFANLLNIQPGDRLVLTTPGDTTYAYEVEATYTTTPDDPTPVLSTDTETVTVYTCTGLFNEKRFIVRARPIAPD